jgi:hypothetical protein
MRFWLLVAEAKFLLVIGLLVNRRHAAWWSLILKTESYVL